MNDTPNCSDDRSHPSDCDILEGYRTRARQRMERQPSDEERLVLARAEPIKLLLLDVDGVLTDGSLTYTEDGGEAKTFCTRDGLGIRLVQKIGVEVGLITARISDLVHRRGKELGLSHICQGVTDKRQTGQAVIERAGLKPFQACYVGDDWIDLALLTRVGLAACPADAVAEVQQACHFVSTRRGGDGAVREICDLIIQAGGARETLLERYLR